MVTRTVDNIEPLPKWEALTHILCEIRELKEKNDDAIPRESNTLILVEDPTTVYQLQVQSMSHYS
jgi:hypothetical protein